MKLNNISFPYPVLGISDDVAPLLKDDAVMIGCDRNNKEFYKLSVSLRIENNYIKSLIEQGLAAYVCEVDCVKTNLRNSVVCESPDFEFNVSRKSVSGNVTVSCYVTVIKPIDNYLNPGAHPDYENAKFDLTPGDILVGFPERNFYADPKFDKLNSVTSFMHICKDQHNDHTNFKLNDDLITINLPIHLFNIYSSGVGLAYSEVIHSSMAQTALLSALYEINNYPNKMWAQAIIELMRINPDLKDNFSVTEEGKVLITDHLKVATMLLKDPYNRMLHKLKESVENSTLFNE